MRASVNYNAKKIRWIKVKFILSGFISDVILNAEGNTQNTSLHEYENELINVQK